MCWLRRLAFLEFMQPSLEQAIARLAADRMRSVRIVPIFFGAGGHVREDLPRLVARAREQHPDLDIRLEPPIGEQAAVIDAIAAAIAGKK